MCGRVQIRLDSRAAAEAFQASVACPAALFERFNAAPSQQLPLLRQAAEGRELVAGSWGFPLGGGSAPRPINARSETAMHKPAFRDALLNRRVALPVTGFYEWKKPDASAAPPLFGGDGDANEKSVWLIESADREPFCLAAITVRGFDGDNPPGFCVMTTRPNAAMAQIHDRMPVVLSRVALDRWLDPKTDPDDPIGLTEPVPVDALRFTPISSRINKPANEGPDAVEPVADVVDGATLAASPAA